MPPRPRRTEYAVTLDRDGSFNSAGRPPLDVPESWTPEHLVLAGLASCILTSLRYHARRAGLQHTASASADGAVMLRDDGRWGVVELDCLIDVELDPLPAPEALAELLAATERGCFVGSSLSPRPAYRWRVNGADYSY